MSAILLGVLPVFLLITLGWLLKLREFLEPAGWAAVERLTYFVFYPAFLVPTIWRADFAGASASVVGVAVVAATAVIGALTLMARPLLKVSGPTYTSIFQGTVRWNSFVALPVAGALFGQEGLALAAVAVGFLVPPVNVASVLVMSRWGDGQGGGVRRAVRSLLANPILWSCAAGLSLSLAGVPLWGPVLAPLDLLGGATLALGLIVAGSGLSFADVGRRPALAFGVCAVKLLVTPLLALGLARLLGGDAVSQAIALLIGAAPGAAASYVLARQMGGDAPLMAGIVAITTVGSALTIPLWLALFRFI